MSEPTKSSEMKSSTLWSDNKTIEDLEFYSLHEDLVRLKERIAELENSNTHAGLRAMYQKAQARIAELERNLSMAIDLLYDDQLDLYAKGVSDE